MVLVANFELIMERDSKTFGDLSVAGYDSICGPGDVGTKG